MAVTFDELPDDIELLKKRVMELIDREAELADRQAELEARISSLDEVPSTCIPQSSRNSWQLGQSIAAISHSCCNCGLFRTESHLVRAGLKLQVCFYSGTLS